MFRDGLVRRAGAQVPFLNGIEIEESDVETEDFFRPKQKNARHLKPGKSQEEQRLCVVITYDDLITSTTRMFTSNCSVACHTNV